MHSTRLVPLFFFVSCAIWAADPFLGEWKLNVDKSDFGSRDKAKKGSTKYKLQLGGYMYESETDYGNGHKARLGMPVKFDGTAQQGVLDGHQIVFVSQKIDANSYKVLMGDGKTGQVTRVFQYVVSSDGLTLTFSSYTTGEEKPSQKLVYDKQ